MTIISCRYTYGDTCFRAGRSAAEVSQKRYRYTGKEKDEESGLYYHGARYYACWLGRWTASDPAGLVDGVNLFAYVRGNPVRLHDPSGKATENPAKIIEDLPGAKVTAPGEVTLPGVQVWGDKPLPNQIAPADASSVDVNTSSEPTWEKELKAFGDVDIGGTYGFLANEGSKEFAVRYRQQILTVAEKNGIDPVAIVGVVAWERGENPRGWISDALYQNAMADKGVIGDKAGIGWGSIHLHIAKELEDQGLVPKSVDKIERSQKLRDPLSAISYIGAIMGRDAKEYKKITGIDISSRPEILATLYHTGDVKHKAESKAISRAIFSSLAQDIPWLVKGEMPEPKPDDMGVWVNKHESAIRQLLGLEQKWIPSRLEIRQGQ